MRWGRTVLMWHHFPRCLPRAWIWWWIIHEGLTMHCLSQTSVSMCRSASRATHVNVLMTQSKVGWVKAILYEKLLRTLQCPNSMEIFTTSLGRKHCMCLRWWELENATLDFYALPASESVQGSPMVVVDTVFVSLCLGVTDSRTRWNISVLCHESGPPCWGVGGYSTPAFSVWMLG